MNEIIVPYVKGEGERLGFEKDQSALLIMDVFKGQKTDPVLTVLSDSHILLERVPANFTYLFQPLDVQGGHVKRIMKKKCNTWYTDQIIQAVDKGQELETIEVELKFSIDKLLHAKWLIEIHNEMKSNEGTMSNDIDLMLVEEPNLSAVNSSGLSTTSKYVSDYGIEEESDEEE